jgi:hypothetical protein
MLKAITFTMDDPAPGWNRYYQWDYAYNASGQIQHQYYWQYGIPVSPAGYKTHSEFVYTADAEGRDVTQTNYIWVESQKLMKEELRFVKEYDLADNLISSMIKGRSAETSVVYHGQWITNSYDSRNNRVQSYDYFWNGGTLSFTPGSRQDFTYDEKDNQTSQTTAYYSEEDRVWVPSYQMNYSFNNEIPTTDILSPYRDSIREGNIMNEFYEQFRRSMPDSVSYYSWNTESGKKVRSGAAVFHYSTFTSAKPVEAHPKELSVLVFPNPAQSFIQVVQTDQTGLLRYQLHDQQGRQVSSGLLGSSGRIDFQSYPRGIYLLTVVDQKGSRRVERVVIE